MRDLRRCRIGLSREEEAELITKAQAGDQAARDRVVEGVLPFCLNKAKKHYLPRQRDCYELEDCFQWAVMGVLRAIETFEIERGLRFLTYASYFVMQQMQYHGRRSRTVVRIPAQIYDAARNGDAECRKIVEWAGRAGRVDSNCSEDEPATLVSDKADHIGDFLDTEETNERRAWLEQQLAVMPQRERDVLRGRLKGMKLLDVADEVGVSRQGAQQIEVRALRRLARAAGRPRVALSMAKGVVGEIPDEVPKVPVPRDGTIRGRHTRAKVLDICRKKAARSRTFSLSASELAGKAGISRTNAKNVMLGLIDRGHLEVVDPGGGPIACVYRLLSETNRPARAKM